MGVKTFVGVSYFPAKLNAIFQRYFTAAGFRVLAMEGVPVQFADVPKFPPAQIADFIKAVDITSGVEPSRLQQ